MSLISRPDLTIADEERLAAEAIARTTGALTVERIDQYTVTFAELRNLVAAGNLQPICPELTNANPAAPHTVILETMAWMLAQMAYRINQIPEQNVIEFARLFGVELRAATIAETILTFTTSGGNVNVPAGTRVATDDESVIFETTAALTIATTATTGDVSARNLAAGHALVAPGKLTNLLDNIASVVAVTNQFALDSGTERESTESALERMRQYQRRGERIVSTKDLETAILSEAMNGNGIVRAFPFVASGDFGGVRQAGHTSVIVMTSAGENVDSITLRKIQTLLGETVGNQFVYVVNPVFAEFNVSANVQLSGGAPSSAIIAAVERNLREFYAPSGRQFGRDIYRSEIIGIIENTSGVDRIEPSGAQILASPLADRKLDDYQLPKLVNVNINVV